MRILILLHFTDLGSLTVNIINSLFLGSLTLYMCGELYFTGSYLSYMLICLNIVKDLWTVFPVLIKFAFGVSNCVESIKAEKKI